MKVHDVLAESDTRASCMWMLIQQWWTKSASVLQMCTSRNLAAALCLRCSPQKTKRFPHCWFKTKLWVSEAVSMTIFKRIFSFEHFIYFFILALSWVPLGSVNTADSDFLKDLNISNFKNKVCNSLLAGVWLLWYHRYRNSHARCRLALPFEFVSPSPCLI